MINILSDLLSIAQCSQVSLQRGPIYCDFTHSAAVTAVEHESDLKLLTDTP